MSSSSVGIEQDELLDTNSEAKSPKAECSKDVSNDATEIPRHLFVELTSLDELTFPINSSSRTKYTCIEASAHFLAASTTSGTIYVFSRYASKQSGSLNSIPLRILPTKDGFVVKMAISPNENYLAVANKNGFLNIFSLLNSTNSTSPHFSTSFPSNSGSGLKNIITTLCWSHDNMRLYAGDSKGQVFCIRPQMRSIFRSIELLLQADGEIFQMDFLDQSLLISTSTRCFLYDLKTSETIQIGKKTRRSPCGAVFYSVAKQQTNVADLGKSKSIGKKEIVSENYLRTIFAGRPNGRLWEANGLGVVYRTYQYKSITRKVYFPLVSFSEEFIDIGAEDVENNHVSFNRLDTIYCEGRSYLLANDYQSFSLINPQDGCLMSFCNVKNKGRINQYVVCGSDIFLMSEGGSKLYKISVFSLQKAVEKLCCKRFYSLVGDLLYIISLNPNGAILAFLETDLIKDIIFNLQKLNENSHDNKECRLESRIRALESLLATVENEGKHKSKNEIQNVEPIRIRHMDSGILRIVNPMERSGYEDDFTFRAPSPVRFRSKSTPNIKENSMDKIESKRRSLRINKTQYAEENSGDSAEEDFDKDVSVRNDYSKVNRLTLPNIADSLKTIIGSNMECVNFVSQVTVSDIPKDLMAAKNFLSVLSIGENLISVDKQFVDKLTSSSFLEKSKYFDFKNFFGRTDPLERIFKGPQWISSTNIRHRRFSKGERRGARIIKAIKPLGRNTSKNEIKTNKEKIEECSELSSNSRNDSLSRELNATCSTVNGIGEASKEAYRIKVTCTENNFRETKKFDIKCSAQIVEYAEKICSLKEDNKDDDENMKESMDKSRVMQFFTSASTENRKDYCGQCGIHMLWRFVSLFGVAMLRLKIVEDHFDAGGVPSSIEQWKNLLDFYIHLKNNENSCHDQTINPCSTCTSCFDFKLIEEKVEFVKKWCSRSLKTHNHKEQGENSVRLETIRWSESAITNMFFSDSLVESPIRGENSELKHPRKATNHHLIDQNVTSVHKVDGKRFLWIFNIELSKLLSFVYFCEGLEALFNLLRTYDHIRNLLSSDDWRWLVGLKLFDVDRHKFVQSKEVVSKLLEELSITSIVDCGQQGTSKSIGYRMTSGKDSVNLIVAIDGNCPCCLLPLKSRVSDTEQFVTAFNCGHTYHRVCLRENAAWKCIRCEDLRIRQQERNASRIVSKTATSVGQKKCFPLQSARINIRMPNSH